MIRLLGTVTACLMAGLVPWSSVRAQVTDKLGVRLPPSLDALTVDSLQLKGGNKTNGLVKLNGVGPSDKDIRVALSSNHPAVQVPAEVLLRGVAQKAFQLSTKAVSQPPQSSFLRLLRAAGDRRRSRWFRRA